MKVDATKRFVLDASVALAWCFAAEATSQTEAILNFLANGAEALVPAIWPFELANALLVGERRKRISAAQVTAVLQRIGDLPITVQPSRINHVCGQVLSVARQQQLTEYDAAYLELALTQAIPLATLDSALKRAARSTGIALITP